MNVEVVWEYIEPLKKESEDLYYVSEEDEKEILKLAKDPEIYNKIINSLVSSIQGYNEIKEAIAF